MPIPRHPSPPKRQPDPSRGMSNHIAAALLAYTLLQMVLVLGVMRHGGASVLPYLALVVLAALVLPACRRFERRWQRMGAQGTPALYRRERGLLWAAALALPFVVAGLFALLVPLLR